MCMWSQGCIRLVRCSTDELAAVWHVVGIVGTAVPSAFAERLDIIVDAARLQQCSRAQVVDLVATCVAIDRYRRAVRRHLG